MPSEYEITYLTDPTLADDARGQADTAVDGQITQLGGAIAGSSNPIRQRLHYPVKKQFTGWLRRLNIQLDESEIENLRAWLKKEKSILRDTIVKTAPRPEITPEMLFKAPDEKTAAQETKETKVSKKPVSTKDVEKGIESALQEEVK